MSNDWRFRLKQLIAETPGLSMKAVSLKAGLPASAVHDILQRGHAPSIDKFISICTALGVSPSQLLEGEVQRSISIPLVGFVSAGEGWTPIDDATSADDAISFDLGAHDTVGIEVRGDSMAPVYRNGDFLVCYRQFGPNADNCIGLDCVVRTADSRHFVKILKRGSRPGRFNLKSYNPVVDDVEDVALAWVAPVAWIKRGGR
jgi:phage repressor protein C with HTH and peptisase S24 domain